MAAGGVGKNEGHQQNTPKAQSLTQIQIRMGIHTHTHTHTHPHMGIHRQAHERIHTEMKKTQPHMDTHPRPEGEA